MSSTSPPDKKRPATAYSPAANAEPAPIMSNPLPCSLQNTAANPPTSAASELERSSSRTRASSRLRPSPSERLCVPPPGLLPPPNASPVYGNYGYGQSLKPSYAPRTGSLRPPSEVRPISLLPALVSPFSDAKLTSPQLSAANDTTVHGSYGFGPNPTPRS